MDHRGGFGRGVAVVDGPRTNFLLSRREVGLEAKQLVAGANETVESRRLESERRQKIGAILGRELRQLGLDLGGEGNDPCLLATLFHGLSQRLEMRTFLARELRIAHVCRVENRFYGEQRQRGENSFFVGGETRLPQPSAFLEKAVRLLQHRQLRHRLLVAGPRRAAGLVQTLLERGEVGDRQLEPYHLTIAHGIDRSHDVRDIGVLEAAHDVDYRVGLANVGQKLVAQSLTLGRAFYEAGDVHELNDCWHRSFRLHDARELAETGVGNLHHADIRLDGAEGIVRRFGPGRREGVEQCRFPDVGEADDTEF